MFDFPLINRYSTFILPKYCKTSLYLGKTTEYKML